MRRHTTATNGMPLLSMKYQTSAMPMGNAIGILVGAAMKYGTGMTGPANGTTNMIIANKTLDI